MSGITGPNPAAMDIRNQISHANMQNLTTRPLANVTYLYVHYTAEQIDPVASQAQEIAHLIGVARYHIQKDWNPPHGVYGYTIMYTYAIGPSGTLYWCNDEDWLLWNTTYGNPWGMATVLLLGPGQQPTAAQTATLKAHLDYMCSRDDIPARHNHVYGHGECALQYGQGPDFGNNTDCPGGILPFVRQYRNQPIEPPQPPPGPPHANNRYFSETGQYISNAFKDEWETLERAGAAVRVVGYPITGEIAEVLGDGKTYTVQYFERARMEWHPENQPPYNVLYGRLGAEIAAYKSGSAYAGCGADKAAGEVIVSSTGTPIGG